MTTSEVTTLEGAAELAQLGVATVYEAAGRVGLLDLPLTPLTPGARVAGPARIAACGQDDNRAAHAAIAALEPGEILVLTMPEPRPVALLGELLATQARQRGAAGVLVDGAVRDANDLADSEPPVWARHIRASGATKDARGALDVPVVVGGTRIRPGDFVVLDRDGAVAVAAERVDEVITASRLRCEREAALRERFTAGELSYDIYGMRDEDDAV